MNRLLQLFITILILVVTDTSLRAQPNSLYFMKGLPQTKEINPAISGLKSGFYFSLPLASALDVSINTNDWRISDLVHQGSGLQRDSMIWDFKNLVNSFDKKNFVFESAGLTLIDFGWRSRGRFYSFSISEHEIVEPFFTRDLAELVYYGNNPLIGSTFDCGDFGLTAMHYRQFAFNTSREVSKWLTFGITGKLLFGMSGIRTDGLNLGLEMPASGEQLNITARGNIMGSVPVEFKQNPTNAYDITSKGTFLAGKYLLNLNNPGLAVDLGISMKISKRAELSASLIDLGFIAWRNNLTKFTGQGMFSFSGINLNGAQTTPPSGETVAPLVHSLRDSLIKAFPLSLNPSKFSTIIPVKLYIAGEYKLTNSLCIGALARLRMFDSIIRSSGTLSFNAAVRKTLSVSATYSLYENTNDNLGVGILFKAGMLQIYGATDNLISAFYPVSARNLNLRLGVNLIFEELDKITRKNSQWMLPFKIRHRRG